MGRCCVRYEPIIATIGGLLGFLSTLAASLSPPSTPHAEPESKPDDKTQRIKDAISRGQPICHCTDSGEVMLLKRRGLGGEYLDGASVQ
jgi:hypothetical protein